MGSPLISVLIPTFNRADTVGKAIASALDGGEPSIEVIVADNGSTDRTTDEVEAWCKRDGRVSLLRHPRNRGPLPNWQSCLHEATGRWIHWLWSDDWIAPGAYRRLLDGMAKSSTQVALCSARIVSVEEGWSYVRHGLSPVPCPAPAEGLLRKALMGFEIPVSPAAALLPKASVERHFTNSIPKFGPLDCNARAIGCDALMILGALHDHSHVYCESEPLVNFRHAADGISVNTDGGFRNAHYGWARSHWAARHGIPRSWRALDYLRIIHGIGWARFSLAIATGLI